jgi:hypothetical protein
MNNKRKKKVQVRQLLAVIPCKIKNKLQEESKMAARGRKQKATVL